MKKLIHLLVFIFLTSTIYSQSFIDTAKVWNIAKCSWSMGQFCTNYSYKFFGDTIINGITYKKLNHKQDSVVSNWDLKIAMRETGNKVYGYTTSGEILMYDFGVNEGDTIKPFIQNLFHPMIVDSVDTVLINGNPKKRILFYTGFNWNYETWIEDIGSLNGIANPLLLNDILIVDYSEITLCYHENNLLVYMDTTVDSCFIITGVKEHENVFFNMFPNPAYDVLNLEFKMNSSSGITIEIKNNLGQYLKIFSAQKSVTGENKISIPVSDLPSGIYFLKLYVENKLITKKFIKI